MQTQIKGNRAETIARLWLESRGLEFIESNYSVKTGEIDLVMRDAPCLVFVEVRYRKRGPDQSHYGGAVASVDHRKQRKLLATARCYLQHRRCGNLPARIDVLDLSGPLDDPIVNWFKNAIAESD